MHSDLPEQGVSSFGGCSASPGFSRSHSFALTKVFRQRRAVPNLAILFSMFLLISFFPCSVQLVQNNHTLREQKCIIIT